MTEPPTFLEGVAQAFRDHGLTAAITALMGGNDVELGSGLRFKCSLCAICKIGHSSRHVT